MSIPLLLLPKNLGQQVCSSILCMPVLLTPEKPYLAVWQCGSVVLSGREQPCSKRGNSFQKGRLARITYLIVLVYPI